MLQSNVTPAELAEKTIDYAEAKESYFNALRAEMPELIKIATGGESRPAELDTFAAAFAVAGEKPGGGRIDTCFAKTILAQSLR